jgi:hypothetical protein
MRILSYRRLGRLGGIAAALFCVGCGSSSDISDRIAGHRASPFSLFGRQDMRAGVRFDVLRNAARKESVKQYECTPLWMKAQRCSVPIETGMLTAILDSTGHVIRLLAATDPMLRNGINVHGQLIFRDVVRDTRVAWDSAGTAHRDDADPIAPELRWLDRTRRWGGSLWYSRAHRADVPRSSGAATDAELAMTLPESLGVTDLPAYGLFAQLRPPAPAPTTPRVSTPVAAPLRPPTTEEIISLMRSDLREVTIAQEIAVHQRGQYETRLAGLFLIPSADVHLELVRPTIEGWSAVATHPGVPGMSCVVFAGYVHAPPTTLKQNRHGAAGEVVCDQP